MIVCSQCHNPKPTKGTPCSKCGETGHAQALEVELAVEIDTALPVTGIQISGSPSSSSYWLRVKTPAGTQSDARLEDRIITIRVEGADEIGTRGEPQAMHTLLDALAIEGIAPTPKPGKDSRGEDAKLQIAHTTYVAQFVTVPSSPTFWQAATVTSAVTAAPAAAAIGWVRDAIMAKHRKTSPGELQRTLLVLDARHAGVLAAKVVAASYVERYGDPRAELGFAATWLVGPTASSSTQLGSAIWDSASR
jgi:hypothetical protein